MTLPPPAAMAETDRVAVVREDVAIGRETVAQGGVRVRVEPRTVAARVPVETRAETAEVERRRVERPVTARRAPWREGDTLVVPVYEERPVTTTVLVLAEEIRVRVVEQRHAGQAGVSLRQDRVHVERRVADGPWVAEAAAHGPAGTDLQPPSPSRSPSVKQTVVALFDQHAAAQQARERLLARGFEPSSITLSDTADGEVRQSEPESGGVLASVRHFFADLFGDDRHDEVGVYADTIARGGAVLKVEVDDDERVDTTREVLESAGAADIDERVDAWRRDHGDDTATSGTTAATAATAATKPKGAKKTLRPGVAASTDSTATTASAGGSGEGVIPVVQESVAVGKRSVRAGGLRVYSRVVEEPVRETVDLREERATVERRAVDRPASAAELTGNEERTIEVTEMVERPVVQKTARVVEEVVVGKDVRQTSATVEETARHTEVQVDTLPGERDAGTLAGTDDDESARAHAFGRSLRDDPQYMGLGWDEVEPRARQRWAERYPDTPWERFKETARRSWDRMTE